jgi:hypothetical protein
MAVTMEPTIDAGPPPRVWPSSSPCRRRRPARRDRVLPDGIPTPAANDLVVAVDDPVAGIVVDCWHWQRQPGGPDLSSWIAPRRRIAYLQLCDAARAAVRRLRRGR